MSEEMKMGEILQARRDTQSSRGGPVLSGGGGSSNWNHSRRTSALSLFYLATFPPVYPKGPQPETLVDLRIWITAS